MTGLTKPGTKPQAVPGSKAIPRLLVATTATYESCGAVRLAAALCARDHSQVLALGVALPFPHDRSGMLALKTATAVYEEHRRKLLDDLRRSLRGIDTAATWTTQAAIGLAPESISDTAANWGAFLILLGLGRHKMLDRAFGGETAVAIARSARTPLIAVPPTTRDLPRHALVAADFTEASVAAGDFATRLLASDGFVTVVHACAFAGAPHRDGDLVDIYRAGARTKLEGFVRDLRARSGAHVDGVMLEGEPATALLAYARREGCDLIALGGHAQGLMDRILLGSVRTQVLRGSKCSVLIVPPGAMAVH
jgi:Universal stress protein UspA and related nucleotide-binding proteins